MNLLTQHLEEMEKEFDEEYGGHFLHKEDSEEIKSFVRSEKEKSRQDALREAEECVPSKEKECDCDFYPHGWNDCRVATLAALKKLGEK